MYSNPITLKNILRILGTVPLGLLFGYILYLGELHGEKFLCTLVAGVPIECFNSYFSQLFRLFLLTTGFLAISYKLSPFRKDIFGFIFGIGYGTVLGTTGFFYMQQLTPDFFNPKIIACFLNSIYAFCIGYYSLKHPFRPMW